MRSQVWQRRALTGIKGQTSGSSSTIWATTNKLFPFAINDASPNNSSLMLNNFTTSIFYRYVWAISRGGKMMSWVSLCSPLDCRKCWGKLLPAIIEHRTIGFGLQTFWKVTNGSGQSCRWFVYCMVQLLKKLYFSPKCQIWLQTLTSAHFGPFYWWKCRANQSGKYEKSVREIGFGVGKKSASAAKVWPSDPGFLIQLNWLFCSCKKEDWPFWERSLDGSQFVIIINGLWSLDAESH